MWKVSSWRDKQPFSWELKLDGIRVVIVRGHIYDPDNWVMHCEPWFNTRSLKSLDTPLEEIQSLALSLVREKIDGIQAQLRGLN